MQSFQFSFQQEMRELSADGAYMTLDSHTVRAKSLYAYTATDKFELSFPANAVMTVIDKHGEGW